MTSPGASITVAEVTDADAIEALVPILLLAEPSERALRWSLDHLSDAVYRADSNGQLAGAATMRWIGDPCEIIELGVAEPLHGRGVGRAIVAALCDEARRRRKRTIEVGTANASIGNLAFYQKCGFRFDHVRHDYFRYHRTPIYENGIEVRDLVVFRRDLNTR
ncbi:MAG TPA: GNAT family N-acetyltransferase [Gemmatirosa sp.]